MWLNQSERKERIRAILKNYLRNNADMWVSSIELEKISINNGYKAETGGRRLREMTQPEHKSFDKEIYHKIVKGIVYYKFISQ